MPLDSYQKKLSYLHTMTVEPEIASVAKIIAKKSLTNNVSNVNKYKYDNNDNVSRDYSYHPEKWKQNTAEAQLAVEMVEWFQDQANFAFYVKLVNREGAERARSIFSWYKGEVREKAKSKTPVRDIRKYFVSMYVHGRIPWELKGASR